MEIIVEFLVISSRFSASKDIRDFKGLYRKLDTKSMNSSLKWNHENKFFAVAFPCCSCNFIY